jgi:hypothetical protein
VTGATRRLRNPEGFADAYCLPQQQALLPILLQRLPQTRRTKGNPEAPDSFFPPFHWVHIQLSDKPLYLAYDSGSTYSMGSGGGLKYPAKKRAFARKRALAWSSYRA